MNRPVMAEYIWLDGGVKEFGSDYPNRTQKLRSKTKVLNENLEATGDIERLPTWGADGSSTNQASGASTPVK